MSTQTASAPALKATDRCDRCPAQAYVRLTFGEFDLLLCAHHDRENPAAREQADKVHDETSRLTEATA